MADRTSVPGQDTSWNDTDLQLGCIGLLPYRWRLSQLIIFNNRITWPLLSDLLRRMDESRVLFYR